MDSIKLGDVTFQAKTFKDSDAVFKEFSEEAFCKLPDREKSEIVNRTLLELIQKQPEPCFLFSEVLQFIERVDKENILHHYIFTSFELWLNQYSNLSFEENLNIRAKIVGKKIPREDYQSFFPIGMGKIYSGTHFVTAHKSPDLDTTIASFWGWMDSFGAKVGDALHIWNLPGGPPPSQIEIDLIFKEIFGSSVFTHLPKTKAILSLTGNDLMTQSKMIRKTTKDTAHSVHHDRTQNAVVLIDKEGFYLGDWRSVDVEGVRQLLMLVNNCLHWFENFLHLNIVTLFSKKILKIEDMALFVQNSFQMKIQDCEPAKELSDFEKNRLDLFFKQVLEMPKGSGSSFKELGECLSKLSVIDFAKVDTIMDVIQQAHIFDAQGNLIEDRPLIFSNVAKIVSDLHTGLQKVRSFMDGLDIALKVKQQVFGFSPKFVTVRADVEEIRSKMGSYQYLTVTYPDRDKFFPVGIIYATDLRKTFLGTVSLRDFCNREEMGIPSYLEVISVIDHHKTELSTFQPPMVTISDAQSSNAIVAELAFRINDRYSTRGMSKEQVSQQIKEEKKPSQVLQTLLGYYLALKNTKNTYYIHPEREMIEYIHFLYGIFDDTDLLSKVSRRDVECVASLLNRLKTLISKKESLIIDLEDIPQDENFARNAANKILQNDEVYSLYKKVYSYREKQVEINIQKCIEEQSFTIFSDTKEHGCARVGQTKMFANNIKAFQGNKDLLRQKWFQSAQKTYEEKSDFDLHLHMISTVVGADEVYQGNPLEYHHKDELWIWAAPTETGIEHLKRFLNAFQSSRQIRKNDLFLEFLGENQEELELIFKESFLPVKRIENSSKISLPIAVLYYKAGSINSRKAMISPYLPTTN